MTAFLGPLPWGGLPRPHRRGRIETNHWLWVDPQTGVSPGLTAGGGLKLQSDRHAPQQHGVSPGLTAGGGLKPTSAPATCSSSTVSPGLTAGGGLKSDLLIVRYGDELSLPRPHDRGRMEND